MTVGKLCSEWRGGRFLSSWANIDLVIALPPDLLGQHPPMNIWDQDQIPEITRSDLSAEAEICATLRWNIYCGSPERETWSDVGEYLVTCDRREEWAVIRASQRQQPQPGYSSLSRSEDQWFVILRNREGQITEIIVTDRFENLAPPASKEYHHHPRHCFQFSELIDSLIALTSLDPSQLAIIYLHGVRVRPSFQSRDQGMVNILLPQYFWSVPLKMHSPNQSFSTLDLLSWHFMDFAS